MISNSLRLVVLMVIAASLHAQTDFTSWTRPTNAPVITPNPASTFHDPVSDTDVHWEALHTFNPAAIMRDGKIYVLYRAEDDSGAAAIGQHTSRLGLASSTDGIHFTRLPSPVLFPGNDAQAGREQPGGVEDPRLVESPDGTYILTYTQWSRARKAYSVGIATSPDLVHWTKRGPAFGNTGKYAALKYKSAGILTRRTGDTLVAAKLRGKYWMYWGEVEIHLATSNDLIHWTPIEDTVGKPQALLVHRDHQPDSAFPEIGPPPLLTSAGIVLLYNAKNSTDTSVTDTSLAPGAYSVEQATFSADDPTRLIAHTTLPVFKPELPFEQSGQYAAGTTFAEGLVWFHNAWWLYYGCADSFVGVATSSPKQQ